jgi:hypothetical protein
VKLLRGGFCTEQQGPRGCILELIIIPKDIAASHDRIQQRERNDHLQKGLHASLGVACIARCSASADA